MVIVTSKHTYCCSKLVQITNASFSEPRHAGKVKSEPAALNQWLQVNLRPPCHPTISEGLEESAALKDFDVDMSSSVARRGSANCGGGCCDLFSRRSSDPGLSSGGRHVTPGMKCPA